MPGHLEFLLMCLWWRYAGSVLGLVIEIGTTRKNFVRKRANNEDKVTKIFRELSYKSIKRRVFKNLFRFNMKKGSLYTETVTKTAYNGRLCTHRVHNQDSVRVVKAEKNTCPCLAFCS